MAEQNANDTSGNGKDGTWSASAAYAAGIFGDAFSFNGSNYVDLSSHVSHFFTPTEGTIMVAFKVTNKAAGPTLISFGSNVGNYSALFVNAGFVADALAYINFSTTYQLAMDATTTLISDSVPYVAVIRGGASDNAIFINGLKQSVTYTHGTSTTNKWFSSGLSVNTYVTIGARRYGPGTDRYLGSNSTVSQVAVFNKSLPDSECMRLSYNFNPLGKY